MKRLLCKEYAQNNLMKLCIPCLMLLPKKNPNFWFFKKSLFRENFNFSKFSRKSDFLKIGNLDCFRPPRFFKKRCIKNFEASLIYCNFSSFQYFLMILDAFEAQTTGAFNAPKNIENGQELEELSQKNVGVSI